MNKYLFILVLLIFLFLVFQKYVLCDRLSCVSIKNLNSFALKEIFEENKNSYRALYTKNKELLRVEMSSIMKDNDASQAINARIASVKGLFIDTAAPYPGVVSDTVTCDKKYKPVFEKIVTRGNIELSYFIGYVNNNLTFGSCSEDQTSLKGILTYFYCTKRHQMYQLELISQTKQFDQSLPFYKEMLQSIQCK